MVDLLSETGYYTVSNGINRSVKLMEEKKRARIKVCVNVNCCSRGSEQVYDRLAKELGGTADVEKTPDCFRFCKSGPNVSVDGTIIHGMRPGSATERVQREIAHPSRKKEGLGSKSIDELDDVLESLFL